ncbi:MAG: cupin domain-containing protein [Candidatus Stygibacter australis]|nr:cupin domain-containing protein [Candidatus Stygibacter australis]
MEKIGNMSALPNFFEDLPEFPFPKEISQIIFDKQQIRIERIVSAGQASPPGFWYDQPQNEWILLLSGNAVIKYRNPDEIFQLKPGSYLYIPAHQLHRVDKTSDAENTLWLAFFFS